jgi:phenylacetate-CoA ligase
VPLYGRFWAAAGVDPARLATLADFARLPLLDKTVLRAAPPGERLHDARRNARYSEERSSGSSGEPLAILKDRGARLRRSWAFFAALLACGYRPGQRTLLLTSRRNPRWPDFPLWAYAGIGADTGALLARCEALRPALLYGPLSTLELMAARRGARAWQPRLVVSTAEQLNASRRAVLERGFGDTVADFYGMTEFGLIAYRRPGAVAYVPARGTLMLEYLPVPGEPGIERLVVTDLAECAAPLIRYDTGDLVRRDPARPGQPIVEFAGRSMDCLLRGDGTRVSPYRLDVFLENIAGVRGFEVVQQADRSVLVTLELEETAAPGTCESARVGLQQLLGTDLPLDVRAGTIVRAPDRKFRPIRSLATA